jgi:hypothetical protein
VPPQRGSPSPSPRPTPDRHLRRPLPPPSRSGWYDAGDHVKYSLPLGYSVSVLALGLLHYEAGYRSISEQAAALRNLRFALDWLVRTHVNASDVARNNVLVAQVGAGAAPGHGSGPELGACQLTGAGAAAFGRWHTRDGASGATAPRQGCCYLGAGAAGPQGAAGGVRGG